MFCSLAEAALVPRPEPVQEMTRRPIQRRQVNDLTDPGTGFEKGPDDAHLPQAPTPVFSAPIQRVQLAFSRQWQPGAAMINGRDEVRGSAEAE
jgi:hypothetical protein